MNSDLTRAADVVAELQTWIEDRDGLSSVPIANFAWSQYTFQISIGDVVVWCSETDEHPVSLSLCQNAWLEHVQSLEPFRPEVEQGQHEEASAPTVPAYLVVVFDEETNALVGATCWSSPEWEQSRCIPNTRVFVAYSVRASSFQAGVDNIRETIADPRSRYHYLHPLLERQLQDKA